MEYMVALWFVAETVSGIRAVLHAQRPDIIGLQEVWDDGKG